MHSSDHWYNILADVGFTLPPNLPAPGTDASSLDPQVPLSLIRQEMSTDAHLPIPEAVQQRYAQWRPTPLIRATGFEKALGTKARIYYKYEGGNLTGSHKLNTAIAQAYYYKRAGAQRLAVGTGAGQWGSAVAAACWMFGLDCRIYMVRTSLENKPHRKTLMELLGAEVLASPSDRTEVGRRFTISGQSSGTLSIALAEAMEDSAERGTRFCAGSGETYSILHSTVIGIEAIQQMEASDDHPDIVIGGLGAGSNFGGIAFPFLGRALTGAGSRVRCVSVEPAACPKLTRGRYAYDYTDSSEKTPLQRMYTLGSRFVPPAMHAGGLRYHGTGKIISALYDHAMIEAYAYQQREVFSSAILFAQSEGLVPAPESAHAVHGTVTQAAEAERSGETPTILMSLSGHGLFDMSAYEAYLTDKMQDVTISDDDIERSLSQLPHAADDAA